ncbi:MAG: hypothetical protein WB987_01200 [Candidatus Acidiferrales bacterium]
MRYVLVLIGTVVLATLSVAAQGVPSNNSLLVALPFASPFGGSVEPSEPTAVLPPSLVSASLGAPIPLATGSLTANATIGTPDPTPTSEPEPQIVQGVYQQYQWQAYLGYTFFRFYESSHPTIRENQNGVNWSIVYYWKNWFGIDGEMAATHGSQFGQSSWFLFGGGGPRIRWSGPRGLEFWGHGLFGGSHFTPQTPFGKQEAFAFEVGGGVDINAHNQRWAFRLGGDMIGSHYFSTYQYSPKFSAGLVFKF